MKPSPAVAVAVALVATSLAVAALPGHAETANEGFARAARAMAEGQHQRAAAGFLAVAQAHPDHDLADDALFSAAKLIEERLADPARALAIYRQLLAHYPQSRTALAASRRAEAIVGDLDADGGGARALARFTAVVQSFSQRPEAESLAMVGAILADFPNWSGTPRALAWMAQVHRRAGRYESALDRYRAVIADWPQSDQAVDAYRGAGDMAARLDRFAEAERYYRQMSVADRPAQQRSLQEALDNLAQERLRHRLYRLSFAVLALVVVALLVSLRLTAGSFPAALSALRAPPFEVLFSAPVAAFLIVAAYTGHHTIGPAVTIICSGSLAVSWLSGAGLVAGLQRRARFGRVRPLLHAVATALAIIALCYVAVHRNRLIDTIIDTVRFGPDL